MLRLSERTTITQDYGPLKASLFIDLDPGYSVLIGENNSGKSALLQYLFIQTQVDAPNDQAALLQSNRSILPDQLVPGIDLKQWNAGFLGNYQRQPRTFGGATGPQPEQLHNALMLGDLRSQLNEFTEIVHSLGFRDYQVVGMQQQVLRSRPVSEHGSGLRSIFPIIAAITNPRLKFIFIDEPEFALEARAQKRLRELFLQKASRGIDIIVATHSHLFVNRISAKSNYEMTREPSGAVRIERLIKDSDMLDISFNLLGNSVSDLFFPENFLIVEGASDQVIADKVRELLGIPSSRVKVFAATSLTRVGASYEAIRATLRPLIADYSPYHERVVCLIDGESERSGEIVAELSKDLGNRLIVLDQPSLEEYLPESLYGLAGRDRVSDLRALDSAKQDGDHRKEVDLKTQISSQVAAQLTREHLGQLDLFVRAVRRADEAGGARL